MIKKHHEPLISDANHSKSFSSKPKNTIEHDNKALSLTYKLINLKKFDQAYEFILNYINKYDSFSTNFFRLISYICLETNRFEESYAYYKAFESKTITTNDSIRYKINSYKKLIRPRAPIEAIEIFKFDRFDILAKITFLYFHYKKINSTWGEKLYAAHLFTWNGIKEIKPIKNSLKDYIKSFIDISKLVSDNEFDFKKYPILLDNKDHVIDGSHRLASAIYFNKKVRYSYINESDAPEYTYKSSLNFTNNKYELHGGACPFYVLTPCDTYQSLEAHHITHKGRKLEQRFSDYMALEYLKLKRKNVYSIILYPSTKSFDTSEAANIINRYADIIYYKKIDLNKSQGRNLIIQAYLDEDWIGNINNKFAGADIQYRKCFTEKNFTRFFLIETNDLNTVLYIKKELRDFFNIGKHSVHTSDSHTETWRISTSLLNHNSLNMSKYLKFSYTSNFYRNFIYFKKWAHINDIHTDEICITGSSILSLYNIRESNDIDYLHRESVLYTDTKKIKSHLSEIKYYGHSFDDIIFNPENHFYFEGIKFASLDVIKKLKANRREQKDLNDLDLIKQHTDKDFKIQACAAEKISTLKSHHFKTCNHTKQPTQHLHIAQFCMQDYGGAGTAALRLHESLRAQDIDNTFLVQNMAKWRPGSSLLTRTPHLTSNQKFISPEWRVFQAKNDEILSKYPHRPQGLEIFSIPWASTVIKNNPDVKNANIINLHWISGTLGLAENLNFLKDKKIVWTLHDMNALTGGCHYASGCQKYKQQCGSCPQLGSIQDNDLSRQIWKAKMTVYKQLDITVVALNQWMANCVKNSSLLSSFPIHIIPNGVPTDVFKPYPQAQIRNSLQIPNDAFVILFGADSVTNIRKGFIHLIRALEYLKTLALDNNIALVTFGQHAHHAVQNLDFRTYSFDYIEKESELALIYSMVDVTVIPSLEDNLPNVVLESLACGTPVVGFNSGGIPDMIEHKNNGYLAPVGNHKELARGIQWLMEQLKMGSNIRLKSRETALRAFNLPLQANSYQKLYNQILYKTLSDNKKSIKQSI
ncbi:Glycosyltransferase involved in cell wall bisynthesis [Desulfomicrobium apsheronum]|uniref:Glycosyltransferase involved in cell wall bisynthesis n=1 Tax=Desulfomicrobium apsheronum TaxID=52560 RepID=A0A1I3TSD0_9BACT|nr:glycosyltransferase family 4 protein [Desulfomicrobium apsheronum]SFJ73383.1 Glycosyltransferase involved in cell wall bisynthesis [Desulfomicrobium apsheronum]